MVYFSKRADSAVNILVSCLIIFASSIGLAGQTPQGNNSGATYPRSWLNTRELNPMCTRQLHAADVYTGSHLGPRPELHFWNFESLNVSGETNQSENLQRPLYVDRSPYNQYTISRFFDRPSEIGFLFLHGLWGNSAQFSHLFRIPLQTRSNFMALTYDGNDARGFEHADATYLDWKREVRQAVQRLLQQGSKKIVIVGHSTGGTLALDLASEPQYQGIVAGLVMYEPAIRVETYLRIGACSTRGVDARRFYGIARMVGQVFEGRVPIYLGLGCEVNRVLDFEGVSNRPQNYLDALDRVQAPALVFESTRDFVVSNLEIRRFVSRRTDRRFHAVSNGYHGSARSGTHPLAQPENLTEFMIAHFHLGQNFENLWRSRLNRSNELARADYSAHSSSLRLIEALQSQFSNLMSARVLNQTSQVRFDQLAELDFFRRLHQFNEQLLVSSREILQANCFYELRQIRGLQNFLDGFQAISSSEGYDLLMTMFPHSQSRRREAIEKALSDHHALALRNFQIRLAIFENQLANQIMDGADFQSAKNHLFYFLDHQSSDQESFSMTFGKTPAEMKRQIENFSASQMAQINQTFTLLRQMSQKDFTSVRQNLIQRRDSVLRLMEDKFQRMIEGEISPRQ